MKRTPRAGIGVVRYLALVLLGTALALAMGPGGGFGPISASAAPPLVWEACPSGSAAGQCQIPRGIAAHPETGHVYVADQGNQRIVEFTAWGAFVKAWGWGVVASGPGDKPRNEIQQVTVDATGGDFRLRASFLQTTVPIAWNASAADVQSALEGLSENGFPEEIASDPGDITVSGPAGGPWTIEFTGANANTDVRQLQVVSSTLTGGAATATVTTTQGGANFEICVPANGDVCRSGQGGSSPGQFDAPQGVAVDSAGNVYVVDSGNRRVQKFDPDGNFMLMFGGGVNSGGGTPANPGNLCTATHIANGDVCGAGSEGNGNGEFGQWALGSFIAIDRDDTPTEGDDTIYVGDENRIQLFDSAGIYIEDLPDPDGVLSSETVQSLALDPQSGDLYLVFSEAENALKLDAVGNELCTLKVERPRAIAADGFGEAYVFSERNATPSNAKIVQFDTNDCSQTGQFSAADFSGSTGLATNICEGSDPPGSLFATSASEDNAFLRAYGTPPEGCEAPPLVPPEIKEQYAVSVNTDGALVRAAITPNFIDDTTYFVEYGTAACAAGGCEEQAPASALQLTEAVTKDAVTTAGVFIGGLQPETTYHYRFVAESSGGGPEFGMRPPGKGSATFAEGLEATFTTPPLPTPPKRDCPNQVFRIGPSAFLPDCRAFEMVSPVDKNGGGIEAFLTNSSAQVRATHDQSAVNGDSVTYATKQAFGDALGSPYSSQYVSSHGADGWTTHSVNAPHEGFAGGIETTAFDHEYKAFSEDLSEAWMIHQAEPPLAPCAPIASSVLYRRDNTDDTYEALHCEPNMPFIKANATIELQGVSADGCRAVFRSNSRLTADAAGPLPGVTPLRQPFQLYESSCEAPERPEGPVRLVSVLPDDSKCEEDSTVGTPSSDSQDGRAKPVWHAFSADARRLYWSCGDTLYLRTDPDLGVEGDEVVVEIAAPSIAGAPRFQTASEDGAGCSDQSSPARGPIASGLRRHRRRTTPRSPPGSKTATELGSTFSGQARTPTHVYLVARKVLTEAEQRGRQSNRRRVPTSTCTRSKGVSPSSARCRR